MNQEKTLVINFFAGAGAGKTTCAWEVAAELKKSNVVTEYVSEYAKELVWDNHVHLLDGSYKNQITVFKEQKRRIDRLLGKVEVIVTDSPLLLQAAYVKENIANFENMAVTTHKGYYSFDMFINRENVFEQTGRIHNLKQSQLIDESIKQILNRNGIHYSEYHHNTIPLAIQDIKTILKKLPAISNDDLFKTSVINRITNNSQLKNKNSMIPKNEIDRQII